MEPVDYVVIGHVTEDVTPPDVQLGGTAAFSALTARALGLRVGIITAVGKKTSLKALEGIIIVNTPSQKTTTYENMLNSSGRKQILHHQAASISIEQIPDAWRTAAIVHIAPIAQELAPETAKYFSPSLLGVTPQGWMRGWNETGHVTATPWESAEAVLPMAGAVVISRMDVDGDDEFIEWMAHQTRLLAVTDGAAGAVLYWNGDRRRFNAPSVVEVDATGAGDIFAAALFFRLYTTRDPWEAARFATQLAARSVTRIGLHGIPTNEEIAECSMDVL